MARQTAFSDHGSCPRRTIPYRNLTAGSDQDQKAWRTVYTQTSLRRPVSRIPTRCRRFHTVNLHRSSPSSFKRPPRSSEPRQRTSSLRGLCAEKVEKGTENRMRISETLYQLISAFFPPGASSHTPPVWFFYRTPLGKTASLRGSDVLGRFLTVTRF